MHDGCLVSKRTDQSCTAGLRRGSRRSDQEPLSVSADCLETDFLERIPLNLWQAASM
jgi:hypothetical protein